VNTPTFSHLWLAVDWQLRLDDPDYLAFVAGLYLLSLAEEDEEPNELRVRRYLWDD
jgi:hypothetical protein